MVVSQNRGTPIQTPKYFNPCYCDPQKGTPNFWKPPYLGGANLGQLPREVFEIAAFRTANPEGKIKIQPLFVERDILAVPGQELAAPTMRVLCDRVYL